MQNEKLRAVSIAVITEYLGVAAEFVVDDAIDDVAKNPAIDGKPDFEMLYFFVCLGKHLPKEVPYSVIKTAITEKLGIRA